MVTFVEQRAQDDVERGARQVRAMMRYIVEGAFVTRRFVSRGAEINSGTYSDHEVTIRDAMPIRDRFALDVHGFSIARAPTAVADFHDKAQVNDIYEREVEAEVPAGEAHVDLNTATAKRMAADTHARRFSAGPGYRRFLITSHWRTFSPPPQDVPLALCDGRTSFGGEEKSNTLFIVDAFPQREELVRPVAGEAEMLAATIFSHHPGHRWWYFSNVERDDVLLFKIHDSDHSLTWRCPHSALRDTSFADANIRESIECRTVVFWDR